LRVLIIKEVVKTHDRKISEEDETPGEPEKLDRLGVYYSDLIPVLIQAIQDQQQLIEKGQRTIEAQQTVTESLAARVRDLERLLVEIKRDGGK
jgi:hypothetical protein